MSNRKRYIIKALIIYITILNVVISYNLLLSIGELLSKFNIFCLSILLLNIFTSIFNTIFLFRKELNKNYNSVLLYNSIFCMISGFGLRVAGYIINYNLGADLSVYFTKNQAGIDYGLHYDIYNFVIRLLFYNPNELSGFSIQVNLIMLTIAVFLFYCYKKSKRYSH